jgi:thiamine-phosphate pyrophosphorylase
LNLRLFSKEQINVLDLHRAKDIFASKLWGHRVTHFHLRLREQLPSEILALLKPFPLSFRDKIILHARPLGGTRYLVKELKLGGVSLPERALRGNFFKGSNFAATTIHKLHLPDKEVLFDKIFIAPIFKSISKKNYDSKFTLAEVKTFISSNNQCRFIALGGITKDKLPIIESLGFKDAGVLGGFWQ